MIIFSFNKKVDCFLNRFLSWISKYCGVFMFVMKKRSIVLYGIPCSLVCLLILPLMNGSPFTEKDRVMFQQTQYLYSYVWYPDLANVGFCSAYLGVQTNYYHYSSTVHYRLMCLVYFPLISAIPCCFNCKSLFVTETQNILN